jgi:hypothetical protein
MQHLQGIYECIWPLIQGFLSAASTVYSIFWTAFSPNPNAFSKTTSLMPGLNNATACICVPGCWLFRAAIQAAVQTTRIHSHAFPLGRADLLTGHQGSQSCCAYKSSPTTGYRTHPITVGPSAWKDSVDRHHMGRPFAHVSKKWSEQPLLLVWHLAQCENFETLC